MVTRTYTKGQMPLEEEVIQGGSVQSLTRNFLGGRGLEAITTTENNVTTTAYPLYDTHGNMVATLTKNASGTSWNVGNERSYDVWGGVRSGSATGGPKGRYCANLGHVQDDESGLIYMRARYYEPSTGRFISEDPEGAGSNWYQYALNSPTQFNDPKGEAAELAGIVLAAFILVLYGMQKIVKGAEDMWDSYAAFKYYRTLALSDAATYSTSGVLAPLALPLGVAKNLGVLHSAIGIKAAAMDIAKGIASMSAGIGLLFDNIGVLDFTLFLEKMFNEAKAIAD